MRKRGRKKLLTQLRSLLTMERAGFGHLWLDPKDPLPTSEEEVTAFIQRRTQLWRDSRVFPLIDELLEKERAS